MEYKEMVEKMAGEILGLEKEAAEGKKKDPNRTTFWHDRYLSGAKKRKAEKVAEYYNEAQLMKQAAEEAYMEAQAMEDAATLAYNTING